MAFSMALQRFALDTQFAELELLYDVPIALIEKADIDNKI
jgi:hypothetical protein